MTRSVGQDFITFSLWQRVGPLAQVDGKGDAWDHQQAGGHGQSGWGGDISPLKTSIDSYVWQFANGSDTSSIVQMNMDEVGDAIPEAGGAEASDKADSVAGIDIVLDVASTNLETWHVPALGVLTDAQCAELASKLAGYWRKLAPKLGLAEDKVNCSVNYLRYNNCSGGSYGGWGRRGGG